MDFQVVRKEALPSTFRTMNSDRPDTVGARIRSTRLELGATIRQLAEQCSLTPEGLSMIERDVTGVGLPVLRRISAALGKPVSYLGKFEMLPVETLGQKIKKARLYRGLSKTELAREMNVDVKSIHNWESDKRLPSNNNVILLLMELLTVLDDCLS
ncbi:transcriptional regulator [Paenibacillus lycopersici]|uniref:Transcriptional regulator n=1 Tax=Paenibacillus lycopersici TaxID=2704462 RepID=A0A6C0G0F8_9BACL|nr:helix-turn-helix transcriptional regulator [Paenibacillus lycopersici]QHT60679.1 transcriptional regulator [Paenibacillus lycopersici]